MLSANSQQKSARKLRRGGIQMANGVHMEEVMQHLKEIKDKLPTKTESSQDVRVELCSWCGENGHNASWCPYNSNQEEGLEHTNMVNGGYYGNQGQPRRFEQNNNTYQPRHPNLSWRSNNVLQPNAPSNPPRQSYVPPFKQQ